MPWGPSKRVLVPVGVVFGIAAVVAGLALTGLWSNDEACPPISDHSEWSVARRWNEANLNAIRRDLPAPTVHARNLFHTSAAMWDAWAAYDSNAAGYFVDEEQAASDIEAARREAISYAAFRVLEARYLDSVGAVETIPELDGLMTALCYPIEVKTTEGDAPAALGNRIAATVLEAGLVDGANEAEGYSAPDYSPVNEPLAVNESGTVMAEPNRWQPLQIEEMVSQNGILLDVGVQEFVDPHWGSVTSFSLPDGGERGVPLDPGDPPYLGSTTDEEFKAAAVEVIHYSSLLDPTSGVVVDISPGVVGNNPLGTHDGSGHPVNLATGAPYAANVVDEGNFGRVLAEFWADGPSSETPPGHWNTLANTISDDLGTELRIGGEGATVDRLEWDVKLYLALNAANHDAAIAAWGTKGHYDYVRPISMIRWMGGLGQSSDPDGPSYDPSGLPLVPGLVEVITEQTTGPGRRHERLAGHEGEVAAYAYAGGPSDPETEIGGVDWILAVDWVPYQAPTFVTPSFAGYVSGHSTFSRASAEVLAGITGSEYFPGGLGEWTIPADSLEFEAGPDEDVTLQWATYRDASDQAGISRLYGGIHVRADDFAGRIMGAEIGRSAWELAQTYYVGSPDDDG